MAVQKSPPARAYASISDRISAIVLQQPTSRGWYIGFGLALLLTFGLAIALGYLFLAGVGIWGIDIPAGWGFAITNFVWWIGIGHAGTLISAILLLLRQKWRTSINRFAEAMTIFAVICATIFPLIHLGRPQYFYWMMPTPTTTDLLPQFQSPLVWDLVAVITYATVSLLFWYIGLIPDIAKLRDRARRQWVRQMYGFLAMGWRGSARHWHRYQQTYFLVALLATPLVISVHSIVGLDFAVSLIPGWHNTLAPVYFVAGAVFSGFAMVLTIAIPLRRVFHLEDLITQRHLNNMAMVLLAMSWFLIYTYTLEIFMAWYSGSPFEETLTRSHLTGPYAPAYWIMLICNCVIVQLLWFRWVRRNHVLLIIIAILINVGMWLERFVIVINSLSRDFLPSSWGLFIPTFWDWLTLAGTIGLFLLLLFLFIRFLPSVAIAEMQEMVSEELEP